MNVGTKIAIFAGAGIAVYAAYRYLKPSVPETAEQTESKKIMGSTVLGNLTSKIDLEAQQAAKAAFDKCVASQPETDSMWRKTIDCSSAVREHLKSQSQDQSIV